LRYRPHGPAQGVFHALRPCKRLAPLVPDLADQPKILDRCFELPRLADRWQGIGEGSLRRGLSLRENGKLEPDGAVPVVRPAGADFASTAI
jgi:hypothetical protein